MIAFSYLFALVAMLGVLIFVHELGHFLVAKWCGVRVLKFSLGFGPPIGLGRWRLAWRWGETEYVIAWFPLGGYVKMLGENPDEIEAAEASHDAARAFTAQPVSRRLAIVFAGPLMNLILPVVVFTGALGVGLPRPAPEVGAVEPASPAAEAGIRPGDRIVAVDGEPVQWWDEVARAVRTSPGETLQLTVERNGDRFEVALHVDERLGLDEFGTPAKVGWAGMSHARLPATLGVPDADSPAARAGLRSGDRVVAVNGEPVEDWAELERRLRAAPPGARVALEIERGPAEAPERLTVEVPAAGSLAELGVVPASVLIADVRPGSPAERAGLRPGDLVLAVDGRPVGSFASFAEIVRTSEGRELHLLVARDGEQFEATVKPELTRADTGLGIPEETWLIGITAETPALPGAMVSYRVLNPLRAVPEATAMTVRVTGTFLVGLKKLVTGEVSRSQIAGPLGIAEIAHQSLQRGWDAYLSTLILISINLGILNLLPIPVLDGGQALLIMIEGIKGKPVSIRTQEIAQGLGLAMLAVLMGFAFWNDLSRYWDRLVEWMRHAPGL